VILFVLPLLLGLLPHGAIREVDFEPTGVSANGRIVFGETGASAPCTWSVERGLQRLEIPSGFDEGFAYGASEDGAFLVGQVKKGKTGWVCRWTRGRVELICEAIFPEGPAISLDGSTVVGSQIRETTAGGVISAFRWRKPSGIEYLRSLDPSIKVEYNVATAASRDGSLVFGWSQTRPGGGVAPGGSGGPADDGSVTACRWDSAGNPTPLGRPDERRSDYAYGCNEDGSVVVGSGEAGSTPVMWNRKPYRLLLGPDGKVNGEAHLVSADGHWSLGYELASGGKPSREIIWRDAHPQWFGDFLKERHLALPKGCSDRVTGISRDGKTMVGPGRGDRSGWILSL